MASLIAKQPKDTRKQTTVSLSGAVLADLELYCRFIDSARDWVINEALKSVFRRDKAFLEWKESGGAANIAAAPQSFGAPIVVPTETGRTERPRLPRPETREPSPAA
jgi:hypothetical protein